MMRKMEKLIRLSAEYAYWSKNGIPDTEGNVQPSIVYSGMIDLTKNVVKLPKLIGNTDQLAAIPHQYQNIKTITTAKHLLEIIKVYKIEK